MMTMACTNTLIQTMVPDQLRGRVMATHVWMFLGMTPFGSFLAGGIAAQAGAPTTMFMGALLCLAGATLFASRLPGLKFSAEVHPGLSWILILPCDPGSNSSGFLNWQLYLQQKMDFV